MKNRTRENCTSGSVRDEDGNILIYSALIGGTMETAASFEARNAPSSYPTSFSCGKHSAAFADSMFFRSGLESPAIF